MVKDRAITYSLLAHIRNTGTLAKGPIDIFIPLIKRVLSTMNTQGIFEGQSIMEIKNFADKSYYIDFPIPVLRKILTEIKREVNSEEFVYFELYNDGAFSIQKYTFVDYEEAIEQQRQEIENIGVLFEKFCESSDVAVEHTDSIFKFIEKNKFSLSKYLSGSKNDNGQEYTIEAQFVDFFKKIPAVYNQIKNIYLGSILAGYIEYNIDPTPQGIELLLDTNFIIGLLDLNTPESTHTCNTLINIAKLHKYEIKVLKDTIIEIKSLLQAKATHFDSSFLQKKVYPEDIYNACDRRKLNRADLERIADNLEQSIATLGISVIYDTSKLQREAKFTEEHKSLLAVRNSKQSALHDAVAILYVKKRRGHRIKDFDKVNCWFVNNAISREGNSTFSNNGFQPEVIKADDLLNILWLSNPLTNKSVEPQDLAEIGLTSIISLTLNSDLPKTRILRELDDNIHKYAQEQISDADILRVATRITSKQLKNIEDLNSLAENDKVGFVRRLEEEADKQKNIEESRIKKLEDVFENMSLKTEELYRAKIDYEEKAKEIDSQLVNVKESDNSKDGYIKDLESKIENFEKSEKKKIRKNRIKKWQKIAWIPFFIGIVIAAAGTAYFLHQSDYDFKKAKVAYLSFQENIVVSFVLSLGISLFGFSLKLLYDRYLNNSNIENFKKGLDDD